MTDWILLLGIVVVSVLLCAVIGVLHTIAEILITRKRNTHE